MNHICLAASFCYHPSDLENCLHNINAKMTYIPYLTELFYFPLDCVIVMCEWFPHLFQIQLTSLCISECSALPPASINYASKSSLFLNISLK
jgi:hypothetical protein